MFRLAVCWRSQSNNVTISYTDTSGSNYTRTWSFIPISSINNDPHLLVAEAEDYNSNTPANATNNATGLAVNYGFTVPDPNSGLLVPSWVFWLLHGDQSDERPPRDLSKRHGGEQFLRVLRNRRDAGEPQCPILTPALPPPTPRPST